MMPLASARVHDDIVAESCTLGLISTCKNACWYITLIAETKSTYAMFESTLWFGDLGVVSDLLHLYSTRSKHVAKKTGPERA